MKRAGTRQSRRIHADTVTTSLVGEQYRPRRAVGAYFAGRRHAIASIT